MAKEYPHSIDLGLILLRRFCYHADIKNWQGLDSDDKQKLMALVYEKTGRKCKLDQKSLDRIIREILNGEVKNEISEDKPTYHTICYVVCKCENPNLPLITRPYQNRLYAKKSYISDFLERFIEPLMALSDKSHLPAAPITYKNTAWYVYMSLFYKENGVEIRRTGRRILTFIDDDPYIKAEYRVIDSIQPEWTGFARHDVADGYLYLNLNTSMNNFKDLSMRLRVGSKLPGQTIYGRMTHTKGDIVFDHVLVLKRIEINSNSFPRITEEGEDESIADIESYLRENQAGVFKHKIPLQDCTNFPENIEGRGLDKKN